MFKRTLLTLVIACLSLPTLSAQDPAKNAPTTNPSGIPILPAANPEDILCRCVTTFQVNRKKDAYYIKLDDKFVQVELLGEGISQSFPVRGGTTFRLFQQFPDGEDKIVYKAVLEQALSGTGKKHIVILKRKDEKSPITSTALDLSTSSMPASTIHFFNESTAALGLQVNTTKTVVKPFTKYTYPFQNTTRDTYTSAKVIMRYKGENKIMASKRLRLVPGRRVILFAFPSRARAKAGSTPLAMLVLQDMP